jgi:hypothetical protein
VRDKGLAKNHAQLMTLFGLANLLIAKRSLFELRIKAQGQGGGKAPGRRNSLKCGEQGPTKNLFERCGRLKTGRNRSGKMLSAQRYDLFSASILRALRLRGYEKARHIGMMAMVESKDKRRIRNATPPEFRDLMLAIARSVRITECVIAHN